MDSSRIDWEPHDRHWIRLRGPWEAVRIDDEGREAPAERIRLPADWQAFCTAGEGEARFTRRFQQPTNLDAEEHVVVTLTNVNTDVVATLNGQSVAPLTTPLGTPDCWPAESCLSYDVTHLLRPTNVLSLQLPVPSPEQSTRVGLHDPVLLEIISLDESVESSE